jgi:hypothetical protein
MITQFEIKKFSGRWKETRVLEICHSKTKMFVGRSKFKERASGLVCVLGQSRSHTDETTKLI